MSSYPRPQWRIFELGINTFSGSPVRVRTRCADDNLSRNLIIIIHILCIMIPSLHTASLNCRKSVHACAHIERQGVCTRTRTTPTHTVTELHADGHFCASAARVKRSLGHVPVFRGRDICVSVCVCSRVVRLFFYWFDMGAYAECVMPTYTKFRYCVWNSLWFRKL